MKKFTLLLIVIALFCGNSFSQTVRKGFLDGRVYLKLKDAYSLPYSKTNGYIIPKNLTFLGDILQKYRVSSIKNSFYTAKSPILERTFLMQFKNINAVDELIKDLEKLECVERAEKAPLFKTNFLPTDYGTTAGNNWHLTKINAQGAWDITHGSPNIKVAVIDNAMYTDHPELINKVVAKIDLANNDAITTPPMVSTTYLDASWAWSHGTHTCGLVGAQTNNGTTGIPSIGFDVSLIAIKTADDSTQSMTAGLEGIVWAADTGAHVINMSWGGPQFVAVMQDIVNYAYNKGCVLVASAGNNGDGSADTATANSITYPAGCDHVISVGSTNGNDVASTFSQYGTWVDVMAPGGYQTSGTFMEQILNSTVYSTVYTSATGGFGKMAGTSMSSPITAGLCGLMLSINPQLTPDEVATLLKSTCTNIESLQDAAHLGMVGAGRINAQAAVLAAQSAISPINANFAASSTSITQGGTVLFTDQSYGTVTSWNWTFTGGVPSSYIGQTPPAIAYSNTGTFAVTLTISDGTNNDTETKNAFVTVTPPPSPSNWITQAAGFTAQYRGAYQITIVDPLIVWATAIDGTNGNPLNEITKTADGGNTWIPNTMPGIPATHRISNLSAASADKAWVAIYNSAAAGGAIYATIDGGTTWTAQATAAFTTASSFPNFVHFFNATEGVCMGDPANNEFEIYTTADGGTTWTVVPIANIPNAVAGEMGWTNVYDVYGSTLWFGTNKGRIYKSIDKGLNWTMTDAGTGDCQKVTFNDSNNGIMQRVAYNTSTGAITTFTMKVTHDGGATWAAVTPAGPISKSDISAVPDVPGMYVSIGGDGAASGAIKYSSSFSLDYGQNWTLVDTAVQYINTRFYDAQTGWASGFTSSPTLGGMYKWDPTVVSVKQLASDNNGIKIYPNPTTGLINIQLCAKNESAIKIYDITGRIIVNKVSKDASQLNIDLSNFSKGIYIVKIQSGDATLAKRIILE